MIRIGILGKIGSGKSYIARNFGYPVFDADNEVSKIYRKDKKIFKKLNKKLPKYIYSFPVDKKQITNAILKKKSNLKLIIKIVHSEIRKKFKFFLNKNKNRRVIIMDIPLLLENKINKKTDILIFVESKKSDIEKRLRKRINFNSKLFYEFKKIQFKAEYKKKNSNFVIKNDFTKRTIKINIRKILKKIL